MKEILIIALPIALLALMGGTTKRRATRRRKSTGSTVRRSGTGKRRYVTTKAGKRYTVGSPAYQVYMKRLRALRKARTAKK